MKNKSFLIIAPHPDDAELGMGGTMLLLKETGNRVVIVDLSSGEPTPYGSEEKRRRETGEASALLGVDERLNLGLPNRFLFDNKESRLLLADENRSSERRVSHTRDPLPEKPSYTLQRTEPQYRVSELQHDRDAHLRREG